MDVLIIIQPHYIIFLHNSQRNGRRIIHYHRTDLEVIQRNYQYYIIILIEDIIKYDFKFSLRSIEFYRCQLLFMDFSCSIYYSKRDISLDVFHYYKLFNYFFKFEII